MLGLTKRETSVAELVAGEFSDKQIAVRLGMSYSEAKKCVRLVRSRLKCKTRVGVAVAVTVARMSK